MKRLVLLSFFAVLGCSSREVPSSADAGTESTQSTALAIVSRSSAFASVLAEAHPVERTIEGGFRLATRGLFGTVAEGALRLEVSEDPGAWLEADGGVLAQANIDGVAVVGRGEKDTSRVFVANDSGVEELRTLASAEAPRHFEWKLRTGPAIASVRLRDQRVEAVDARGVVRIQSAPMFAVDARGKRVELRVALEGSRLVADLEAADLAYPVIVDPAWTSVGVVVNRGVYSSGVRLDDGRVLAVPGDKTTSELFDPATNTWKAGPTVPGSGYGMDSPGGYYAGMAKLGSGKVLIVYKTAAVYDPTKNTWTATGTFSGTATQAVTLPGGTKVLAMGGASLSASTAAYIYDSATNTWSTTGAMTVARAAGSSIDLADGRVLVVGGAGLSSAEIYNPSTGTFAAVASMSTARTKPVIVRLTDGRVLVSSGNTAEIYNPKLNTWAATPNLASTHSEGMGTLLANGKVLVVGGSSNNVAEIYDPTANTWSGAGTMASERGFAYAVRLANNRVLLAHGASKYQGTGGFIYLDSSELYGDSLGAGCTAGWQCASGYCVEGVCCSTASCGAGASCATATKKGSCVYPIAAVCSTNAQCESGFCADGVCCNSACTAQCESCNQLGKTGVCSAVFGNPVGSRPACTGAGAGTACGDRCDGVDRTACHVPGAAAACGTNACAAGIETHASTCDSSGKCGDVPKSCGAYACAADKCKSSCTTKSDCAPGNVCKTGACVPADGLGIACTSAAECATGFCTDGVCCGVADCGLGKSCATEKKGTCAKTAATECGNDLECGSGHCVDGVCCDTACDGQCEACDVAGKLGKCTAVAGKPHSFRPKCDDGGGDVCKAHACDGSIDPKSCVGYENGGGVECGNASCSGSTFQATGACDGKGTCVKPESRACAPYACDQAGCRSGCGRNEHCSEGYACVQGSCQPLVATCSEDRLTSTAKDGTQTICNPFRCGPTGQCIDKCGSSSDCAPGAVCDPVSRNCVAANAGGGDEGGCVYGSPGSPGAAWALGMALLGLGLVRRRMATLR